MTKPMVKIHNIETGEVIEREMNDDELTQQAIDKAEAKIKLDSHSKAETDKTALLEKLGITESEAALLLS